MTKARDLSQVPNASLGFKNRIINGAMMIDQRNAGASVTPTTTAYTLDRWEYATSTGSKVSIAQSSVAPAGFTNSLGVTSLSAYSVVSNDFLMLRQKIEGFNCSDLDWGASNAQSVTLSFWVRSSLTGTFGGAVTNNAQNRSYPFSYTINAANTWEYKTVAIVGDTTGTWLKTNGTGIEVRFSLGMGSTFSGTAGAWVGSNIASVTGATSVVGTNGATFFLTGVQLEKGSTATSFDYRPYGTELALCQRYCYVLNSASYSDGYLRFSTLGVAEGSTSLSTIIQFPVQMRATPTLATSGSFSVYNGLFYSVSSINYPSQGSQNACVSYQTSGLTQGLAYQAIANNNNTARQTFSAEL